LVLEIDQLVVHVLEHLPPVGVGAPDLHVTSLSRVLDVEGLVVQLCLDGQ
jgi:hypothetical protein